MNKYWKTTIFIFSCLVSKVKDITQISGQSKAFLWKMVRWQQNLQLSLLFRSKLNLF